MTVLLLLSLLLLLRQVKVAACHAHSQRAFVWHLFWHIRAFAATAAVVIVVVVSAAVAGFCFLF